MADLAGRKKILGVHAEGKKLSSEVDLGDIAKRCLGMNGAELANVMNEAAIATARNKKDEIEPDDIYNAIERM